AKVCPSRSGLLLALAMAFLPAPSHADGDVDAARLKAADTESQNWFTLGRDGNQTYFSPLSMIDATNVDRLGFARAYDLGDRPCRLSSRPVRRTFCLIADVQMLGVTGLDLHQRLSASGTPIPIILITACPDDGVRARALCWRHGLPEQAL